MIRGLIRCVSNAFVQVPMYNNFKFPERPMLHASLAKCLQCGFQSQICNADASMQLSRLDHPSSLCLIGFLSRAIHIHALPQIDPQRRLIPQLTPDPRLAPLLPGTVSRVTHREQQPILITPNPLPILRLLDTVNNINLGGNLLAKRVEREIVDIVAERVLELGADEEETKDEVRGHDGAGDGDPLEGRVELEGEQHDVDPGHLGDGDGVGDGEGGVEDAFCAGEDVVQGGEHVV